MKNYSLLPEETVLFQSKVQLGKKKDNIEFILTNLYLVFIKTTKKLFSNDSLEVSTIPVKEIKFYNGEPQIKHKDVQIDIYLTSNEIEIHFDSKLEAQRFLQVAMQLLTGKTIAQRGADKVKEAIGLVDNTLGISTVGTVKNVLEKGITGVAFGSLGKKSPAYARDMKAINDAANIIKNIVPGNIRKKESEPGEALTEKQVEALKRLKELVDAGILTQEEFEAKKKQILGL